MRRFYLKSSETNLCLAIPDTFSHDRESMKAKERYNKRGAISAPLLLNDDVYSAYASTAAWAAARRAMGTR